MEPIKPKPSNEHEVRDIAPRPFEHRATQRIADGDARALLAFAIVLVFLIVFGVDVDACLVARFCKDANDVEHALTPFAGAIFTAMGSAIAFYFADRSR